MKKSSLILVLILLFSVSFSQKEEAKKWIDTLASDSYFGRGYVNNGDKLAADFIAKKYKEFGANSFGQNYFQEVSYDVNTFPGKVEVQFQDTVLKTGLDFIVAPNSGSAKGEFELVEITVENYQEIITKEEFQEDNFPKAYVIILDKPNGRKSYFEQLSLKTKVSEIAPLFIVNDDKFTWSVSQEAMRFPIIEIKSKFLANQQKVTLNIENKLIKNYKTQNVVGFIKGKKCFKKKKYFVFTAHYDHLGMMGEKAIFNGANDNASGTAMLLSLMKYFSENPPEYSVLFIAFTGEEIGLLGSKQFVENPLVPLKKMKFLYNVDMVGTGVDGIQVVNSTLHPKEFDRLKKINEEYDLLSQIKPRGKAANSDHYRFEEAGVPAFFSYTLGGVSFYHDIQDRPETLPLTEFDDLHKLIVEFVKSF